MTKECRNSLSFSPPWEPQTPLSSLGTPDFLSAYLEIDPLTSKTLEISYVTRPMGTFCYTIWSVVIISWIAPKVLKWKDNNPFQLQLSWCSKGDSWKDPKDWVLMLQKATKWSEDWNLQSLLYQPSGRQRGLWLTQSPVGEGNGTPLQYFAWKIPWTEEPSKLQSMGLLRVGHDWVTSLSLFTFMHWRRKWQPIPVFLPGESQGRGSLVGCHLWGHTELDTTKLT